VQRNKRSIREKIRWGIKMLKSGVTEKATHPHPGKETGSRFKKKNIELSQRIKTLGKEKKVIPPESVNRTKKC